jgi:endopeptidase La
MTDIDNWLNHLKNDHKSVFNGIDNEDAVNVLRIMALDTIIDFFTNKKMCGRRLSIELNDVSMIFKSTGSLFNDIEVNDGFKYTLKAFLSVVDEMIEEIKMEIYNNGKKTINDIINKLRKEYGGTKRAKLCEEFRDKQFNFSFNLNKSNNIDEDDSEAETTESEYDDNESTDNNSTENDIEIIPSEKDMMRKLNTEIKTLSDGSGSVDDAFKYFKSLKSNEQMDIINNFKEINTVEEGEPSLIKLLRMKTSLKNKKVLCKKFLDSSGGFGSKDKLKDWIYNAMKLPFGQYKGVDIKKLRKPHKIQKFLNKIDRKMNNAVYGHEEAKESVLQMMSQMIRNPKAKGNVFALYGCPGNGKTTLIKEGIAKAMKKPFVFISLGGAQDASFLEGHSFTYEGSIYGRIAQGLMDSGCMDPIFYFDELDKVSNTDRGREIINLLVHLTDPVQNSHFKDKYFYDLDIDLSKATFIFSFNDISNVNYILRDRITCIETKFLNVPQKLHIASKYLLPSILKDIGLNKNDINIDEKYMYKIIENYTYEGGVRKIKKILYDFCRKLNTFNLTGKNNISFPYTLDDDMYSLLTKKYNKIMIEYVHQGVNVGMVNGLWANSMGVGGVLPIESTLIPTKKPFEIKTTGSLMKVIRESINVAQSVAWNYIDTDTQIRLMKQWKKRPVSVHIHCPDGATPKDGPSAGAAMSLTIYSQFTGRAVRGDIAMTGEINLRGEVTKIGGLEEKLTGAKKAGAALALVPYENNDDLIKIKERNSELIDDNFNVYTVKTFDEVLEYCLL